MSTTSADDIGSVLDELEELGISTYEMMLPFFMNPSPGGFYRWLKTPIEKRQVELSRSLAQYVKAVPEFNIPCQEIIAHINKVVPDPVIADLYMRIYFKDFLRGIYVSDGDSIENSEMFLRVANRLLTQYGCQTYPVTPMTAWSLDIPSHPVDKHIMNNLDCYSKHVNRDGKEIFHIPATLFEDVMIMPVMHYFESFVTGAIDQLSEADADIDVKDIILYFTATIFMTALFDRFDVSKAFDPVDFPQ